MVLSEVAQRLMMSSGSDASTRPAECGRAATSRLIKVTTTTVRAGHRWPVENRARISQDMIRSGSLCVAPIERRFVNPDDAMEDHGDLPGDGDLRLVHANPLGKPVPGSER